MIERSSQRRRRLSDRRKERLLEWMSQFWAVRSMGGCLDAMMVARGQLHKNLGNVKEIFADFKVMAQSGVKAAAQRAQARRPTWHRLPYGIPLCIGFVGYLGYLHFFAG